MELFGIRQEDVGLSFVRSAGPGGQHVNKASTAVRLIHIPTGVSVKYGGKRSQAANRIEALEVLLSKIGRIHELGLKEEKIKEYKRLRSLRKRPSWLKKRILESKKRRSEIKSLRRKIDSPAA